MSLVHFDFRKVRNNYHEKTGLTCIRKNTAIPSLCSLIIPPMDREVLEP